MTRTNGRSVGRGLVFVFMVLAVTTAGSPGAARPASPGEAQAASLTYKTVGDKELKIYFNYPPGWKLGDKRPAIIFFFGGAWTSGTVRQFAPQAEYFASRGLVTARAEYRLKSTDGVGPDKCVEDARSAIRWLKKNARLVGIDPKKLITAGGSAGGHLAACAIIGKSVEARGEDLSVSTMPAAMLLYNPVLSFEGDSMRERFDVDKKIAELISPTKHLTKKTPPALILYGSEDRLKAQGDEYRSKAKELGVRAEEYVAEGQGHSFFNRSPWRERTTIVADKFLASLGYLKGEPTVTEPSESGGSGEGRGGLLRRLAAMDTDGDGKISKDEAQGRIKENFERLDSNGDGFIDRAELGAVGRRMAQGRFGRGGHPDTSDWPSLFAADLSDADKPEGVWTVEDGVLTASEDQAIWTTKDYENFVLDLEFKTAEGTNSGVVIYCTDTKDWIPNSVEVQICDDFAEEWAKQPGTWHCGAIFGHLAPSKSAVKKPGEWNRFTLRCRGQRVSVVLNGEPVTSMDMSQWTSGKTNPDGSEIPSWLPKPFATLATKGKIGLQGKHAGAPIWFRNIKIRELGQSRR